MSENFKLPDLTAAKREMFRKTHVTIYVCKTCGDIHSIKASNMEETEEKE